MRVLRYTLRSWIALLVSSGLVAGCTRDAVTCQSVKGYNLVVVNIDTLRADHLSYTGYGRTTSPFIDSLAAQGVRFDNALANSSYTRESVSALLSGRLPSRSGAVGWTAHPAADAPVLGEIFQAAGYKTGFFSNTTMLTDAAFTRGFEAVEHLARNQSVGPSRTGGKLSARALQFVQQVGGHPFMMYLHYLDPHAPYDPPPDLYLKFAGTMSPNPLDLYRDVRPNCAKLVADGFGPGEARP